MNKLRLLLLGGTREGRELADHIGTRFPQVELTYAIAGRTDAPRLPACAIRRGGFGGAAGLTAYLRDTGCDAVIDATHPFAARISENAVAACAGDAVPLFRMDRPPWSHNPADEWLEVEDYAAAASRLEAGPWVRAFLTTGRTSLSAFGGVPGMFYLVRLFEAPRLPLPLPDAEVIVDRGPFTVDGETALMRDHGIEVLVTKASGGAATHAKLLAARELGLPVIMVRRPAGYAAVATGESEAAHAWIAARLRERCNADSRKCVVDPNDQSGHEREV